MGAPFRNPPPAEVSFPRLYNSRNANIRHANRVSEPRVDDMPILVPEVEPERLDRYHDYSLTTINYKM